MRKRNQPDVVREGRLDFRVPEGELGNEWGTFAPRERVRAVQVDVEFYVEGDDPGKLQIGEAGDYVVAHADGHFSVESAEFFRGYYEPHKP